jgi:hypothetical protein
MKSLGRSPRLAAMSRGQLTRFVAKYAPSSQSVDQPLSPLLALAIQARPNPSRMVTPRASNPCRGTPAFPPVRTPATQRLHHCRLLATLPLSSHLMAPSISQLTMTRALLPMTATLSSLGLTSQLSIPTPPGIQPAPPLQHAGVLASSLWVALHTTRINPLATCTCDNNLPWHTINLPPPHLPITSLPPPNPLVTPTPTATAQAAALNHRATRTVVDTHLHPTSAPQTLQASATWPTAAALEAITPSP